MVTSSCLAWLAALASPLSSVVRLADVVEVLEVDKQLEPRAAETRAGLEEGWRKLEYFWTQVPSCIGLPCQSASH